MTERQTCGTTTGLRLHITLNEPLCPPCAHLATTRALTNERRQPQPKTDPQPIRDLRAIIAILAQAMTRKDNR